VTLLLWEASERKKGRWEGGGSRGEREEKTNPLQLSVIESLSRIIVAIAIAIASFGFLWGESSRNGFRSSLTEREEGRGAEQRGGEVREVSNREQQREEGGLLGSFSILLLSELETRFELFSAISVSLGILEEAIMNRAAALWQRTHRARATLRGRSNAERVTRSEMRGGRGNRGRVSSSWGMSPKRRRGRRLWSLWGERATTRGLRLVIGMGSRGGSRSSRSKGSRDKRGSGGGSGEETRGTQNRVG
jgi:hypothetical protein